MGLILGGILAQIDWRLVFLVSVPVGVFGTAWSYLKLRELSKPRPQRIDWAGNAVFAVGLTLILIGGVTYGLMPYGSSQMGGWGDPYVMAALTAGAPSSSRFHSWRGGWRSLCSGWSCSG